MGNWALQGQRFSTRLVVMLVILILVTTLSAGAPAYWLARTQLEQQTWANVQDGQQAVRSLLQAEQERLLNLATLFAERPTLQRLLQTNAREELDDYRQAFQTQSRLDILLFCDIDGQRVAGEVGLAMCPPSGAAGFSLIEAKPVLLVSRAVQADLSDKALGIAVTGIWLDELFLGQLAAGTNLKPSIIAASGLRLSSSIPNATGAAIPVLDQTQSSANGQSSQSNLEIDGRPYYVAYSPLAGNIGSSEADATSFILEVALPVDDLMATERRALAILITSTSLVAIVGVGLGIWMIGRLTQPLAKLTQVAERISRGDLMTPIPAFAAPVEIATLSTALIKSQASMLRTLEERSQARDWLNNLIQSIVEGVVTFDNRGNVTFLSQGAENLTGWRSDEIVGQSINRLFPSADQQREPFIENVPPAGGKRVVDVLTRSGKAVTLAITGAQLAPPNGKTAQVALVLRDVTHEEALRNLHSYFLANISHEFQTPLSTLNASIELLMDEAETYSLAEVRELLRPAHMSLLGLQNLINNLLQSGRIEAGRFLIRRDPTDLRRVIDDALRLVQPLLDRRQQPLALVGPFASDAEQEWPEIQADAARLTQVVVNLLVNASKYSPTGSAIEVWIELSETQLRLAVADRGPGIPPDERLNLFRRFVRLDSQAGEQYGVGLGLHVVKTTIEAHGGQIGIDDRPGGGSIFWCELPLAVTNDENVPGT